MGETRERTGLLAEEALWALIRKKLETDRTTAGKLLRVVILENDNPDEAAELKRVMIRALSESILRDFQEPHESDATVPERVPVSLPETAPEFYLDRIDRLESPVEFLRRVWQPWLDAGVLHQFQLKSLDLGLLTGLKSFCQKRGLKVSQFVPTKSDFGKKRDRKAFGEAAT